MRLVEQRVNCWAGATYDWEPEPAGRRITGQERQLEWIAGQRKMEQGVRDTRAILLCSSEECGLGSGRRSSLLLGNGRDGNS